MAVEGLNVDAGAVAVVVLAVLQTSVAGWWALKRRAKNPLENGMDWVVAQSKMMAENAIREKMAADREAAEMRERITHLEARVDTLTHLQAVMQSELARLAALVIKLGGDPDEGRPNYGVEFKVDGSP